MIKGLRKRPTYDELAEIVENNVDIVKKYPDRRAITMRNHPYLTTLDGESFLNALNFTQETMIKGQQRDLLIRTYATQTDEMSHLEFRAKNDRASSTVFNTDSSTSPLKEKTPIPTRRNLVETFDMTVDDATMAMEEDISQQLQIENTKVGQRKMKLHKTMTDMLKSIRRASSSAAAADVIEDLDLSEIFPMQVNKEGDQQKREANTPPSSNEKKNKRMKAKSDLLEIDNPEEQHESKGSVGRPLGSAKSSLTIDNPEEKHEPTKSSSTGKKKTIDKQHGVKKDTHTGRTYWKKQNLQYIYEQLELDGKRFTVIDKKGKEDVFDPILGKKVKKKGNKLTKDDLLEMIYKSRNI